MTCIQTTLQWETVQWNDIDLYHAFRDFTTDPVTFPMGQVKMFIEGLVRVWIHCRTSCHGCSGTFPLNATATE